MNLPLRLADLDALPVEDRLLLVEHIWDSLIANPADLPVPDWHQTELERRIERHNADQMSGDPWSMVVERLRQGVKR